MKVASPQLKHHFLSGGGEMGDLIRSHDWSNSAIGKPETWPQSLLTSLSIILHSKFPTFLCWGPKLICFYNDAFRLSLGQDGKYPFIPGRPAEQTLDAIWHVIKPLLVQVQDTGEAILHEDLLIPIFKNNIMEDVYWTLNFSPVYDEAGDKAGVIATCNETTDKVKYLKELTSINDALEFAIEGTELGTFDYNPVTNKFSANARLKEWFGLPPKAEIELQHAIAAIAQNDREKVVDAIQKTLNFSSGGHYDMEYTIVHPLTKKETFVRAKGRAWFTEQKIAYRFNGTLQDVSKEVRARKIMEISEQRFLAAIAAVKGFLWTNTPEGKMAGEQPAWAILTGQTYEEYQGYGWANAVHPDDAQPTVVAWNEAVQERKTFVFEHRIKLTDGSWGQFSIRARPILNDDGSIREWVGVHTDITEQKRAEKNQQIQQQILFKSQQKFRLLADSMLQHIWTSDTEGNLNYFNQSVFDFSGLTIEEINKDGWIQIVHPDDKEGNINAWTKSVTTGEPFLFEHRFRRHDGEYRWQLSRAIPQKDAYGNIQMWVGTSTDIEDQKIFTNQLEKEVKERTAQLEQKNIDLEKMNKELQSFAYISSHDLQEPLRKIQTFASRILEKEYENLSDNGKDQFVRMRKAAERMQTLIDDLLAYSHTNIDERKFEIVNLGKIMEEVKSDFAEEFQQAGATIEIGKMYDIPIIPFQFRQLLHNLISNSLKFSIPGQSPHIQINSEMVTDDIPFAKDIISHHKTYCHISVSDNGIGFDKGYSKKIFELFQRLHGREAYSGTGIGLAIVKKIIENHHGFILANGVINKGATFDIYIPANL